MKQALHDDERCMTSDSRIDFFNFQEYPADFPTEHKDAQQEDQGRHASHVQGCLPQVVHRAH